MSRELIYATNKRVDELAEILFALRRTVEDLAKRVTDLEGKQK
jgi:hypothetical protein